MRTLAARAVFFLMMKCKHFPDFWYHPQQLQNKWVPQISQMSLESHREHQNPSHLSQHYTQWQLKRHRQVCHQIGMSFSCWLRAGLARNDLEGQNSVILHNGDNFLSPPSKRMLMSRNSCWNTAIGLLTFQARHHVSTLCTAAVSAFQQSRKLESEK